MSQIQNQMSQKINKCYKKSSISKKKNKKNNLNKHKIKQYKNGRIEILEFLV